jgi:hypothetical protein
MIISPKFYGVYMTGKTAQMSLSGGFALKMNVFWLIFQIPRLL